MEPEPLKNPIKRLPKEHWILFKLENCKRFCEEAPSNKLQATRTAITEADRAGAQNVEPAMLTGAREKLDSAAALIEQQEYEKAKRLLEQAELDARLAEARAHSQELRNEIGDIKASIDSLQRNLESQN